MKDQSSTSLISRQYGTSEASGETPNALRPILQPVVDTMNQIRIKMNDGILGALQQA